LQESFFIYLIRMKFFQLLFLFSTLAQCHLGLDETKELTLQNKSTESVKACKIIWHGLHNFSESDQEKLQTWLRDITQVTRSTIGVYQFDVHYYLHPSDGQEPVPYAHTSRRTNKQAVHFYVNPNYSLDEFLGDWTAQHEISHLSIPFVGKENMWFSEGYATYLSRKIMINQGYYTNESFDSIYYNRIGKDESLKKYPEMTLLKLCNELKKQYNYPSLYYAGSSFFYLIDKQLQKEYSLELMDIITYYQNQNRLIDNSLIDVLTSFDEIVGDAIFSKLYSDYSLLPSKKVLSSFWQ